jgi:hypothetical protein
LIAPTGQASVEITVERSETRITKRESAASLFRSRPAFSNPHDDTVESHYLSVAELRFVPVRVLLEALK